MSTETTPKTGATASDRNADPITDESGAHPTGVGIGATIGGAAAGAAAGALAGPVGTMVGAIVGAVAGGYLGKGVAESIDPTVEDAYWRETHTGRPYYESGVDYGDYQAAYQYGWEAGHNYRGKSFEEVELELERGWEKARSTSTLSWQKARAATRDAWDRIHERRPVM